MNPPKKFNQDMVINEFKNALVFYCNNPKNKDYQHRLVWASHYLYQCACQTFMEDHPSFMGYIPADDYMPIIQTMMSNCWSDKINISEEKSQQIQKLLRRLSCSDNPRINQAFHAINLAYCEHVNPDFISSQEDKICSQLFSFHQTLIKIKLSAKDAEKMEATYITLENAIKYHASLTPEAKKQNYSALEATIKETLGSVHKIISHSYRLKTIAYNLLAAVAGLGVFYGLYLYVTQKNRPTIFLQPREVLTLQQTAKSVIKDIQKEVMPEEEDASRNSPGIAPTS